MISIEEHGGDYGGGRKNLVEYDFLPIDNTRGMVVGASRSYFCYKNDTDRKLKVYNRRTRKFIGSFSPNNDSNYKLDGQHVVIIGDRLYGVAERWQTFDRKFFFELNLNTMAFRIIDWNWSYNAINDYFFSDVENCVYLISPGGSLLKMDYNGSFIWKIGTFSASRLLCEGNRAIYVAARDQTIYAVDIVNGRAQLVNGTRSNTTYNTGVIREDRLVLWTSYNNTAISYRFVNNSINQVEFVTSRSTKFLYKTYQGVLTGGIDDENVDIVDKDFNITTKGICSSTSFSAGGRKIGGGEYLIKNNILKFN